MPKTPAGQRKTGVEREKSRPEGGTKGSDPEPIGRLEVESERSEPEGGAKRTAGNPGDAGDRSTVESERRDSVVEVSGPGGEE